MRPEICSLSLVLLGLCNSFVNVTGNARPVGTACVIASKPGVCKKISDCHSAWNKKVCENILPLREDVCSNSEREMLVCCPRSDPTVVKTVCLKLPSRIWAGGVTVDAEYAVAKTIEMCQKYSRFKRKLRKMSADDRHEVVSNRLRSLDALREGYPVEDGPDADYDEYGFVPRITNGTRAKAFEFPHMAAVGLNKSDTEVEWACGGTLISDLFVLTAGHCVRRHDSVASWVQLGNAALNANDSSRRYRVVERILHPLYRPPALYNDIALLRLDRRVEVDQAVHPACLQTQRVDTGLACTATGWGLTDWERLEMSNNLLKVRLQVQQAARCAKTFKTLIQTGQKLLDGIRDESIICAGDPSGGQDTCQGDSGGPIMVKLNNTEDMYTVIGVTSYGDRACGNGAPALYTRVSYFVPWIVGHVWPPPPSPSPPPTLKRNTAELERSSVPSWVFTP